MAPMTRMTRSTAVPRRARLPWAPAPAQFLGVRRAIYPGSFDPLTFGHLDVLQRAAQLFDEVVIAIAFNDKKTSLFSTEERLTKFHGLLMDFARAEQACAVVRGLRAVSDFEFEFQMALMNRKLEPAVETIFLTPREEYTYLSSRIVKEIARLGGNVAAFVPPSVVTALREKLAPLTKGSL
jgi:pantetheine-phosphate adenylyltransferase